MVRQNLIKTIKKQLLELKEELLVGIDEDIKSETNESKFEIGDVHDYASSEREREISRILGDRDREKLLDIDDALQRIDDGTYGICEECGEPIGEGRLKVMPFARECIECKTIEEREMGAKKRYDDHEVIGKVDMITFEDEE